MQWENGNDLDLHVLCPCGTHISYVDRICEKCKANLDVDMNANYVMDDKNPIENIYLDIVKPGIY